MTDALLSFFTLIVLRGFGSKNYSGARPFIILRSGVISQSHMTIKPHIQVPADTVKRFSATRSSRAMPPNVESHTSHRKTRKNQFTTFMCLCIRDPKMVASPQMSSLKMGTLKTTHFSPTGRQPVAPPGSCPTRASADTRKGPGRVYAHWAFVGGCCLTAKYVSSRCKEKSGSKSHQWLGLQ